MPDILISGLSQKHKIRFTYADTTVSSKALEARHLSGPTAGMILAEGLTSVAMLSCDASCLEESISFQLKSSGPIGGFLVEAFSNGDLRGYTNIKILNDLDGGPDIKTDPALGDHMTGQIIKSIPGKILSQARINIETPSIRALVARFFNHSLQTPTAVELHVHSDTGGIIFARGIIAERMPDGDHELFLEILEKFNSGSVYEQLAKAGDLISLADILGIDDVEEKETRRLQFRCRCSRLRAESTLSTIPLNELEEMVKDGKSHSIHCHLCGEDYTINTDTIRQIVENQRS